MHTNETAADVAMRYIRDELSTLRASMHEELAAIRIDLSELSAEMRGHMAEHGPRVAVLEHRLGQAEAAIAEVKNARTTDRAQRWGVWMAVLAAVLSTTVPTILKLVGG